MENREQEVEQDSEVDIETEFTPRQWIAAPDHYDESSDESEFDTSSEVSDLLSEQSEYSDDEELPDLEQFEGLREQFRNLAPFHVHNHVLVIASHKIKKNRRVDDLGSDAEATVRHAS